MILLMSASLVISEHVNDYKVVYCLL